MPMELEISELSGASGSSSVGRALTATRSLGWPLPVHSISALDRRGRLRFTLESSARKHRLLRARRWLERCSGEIAAPGEPTLLRRPFPGFAEAFHASLVSPDNSTIALTNDGVSQALRGDAYRCFQRIVDIYSGSAHQRLAVREVNRPDVVLMCIPAEILRESQ